VHGSAAAADQDRGNLRRSWPTSDTVRPQSVLHDNNLVDSKLYSLYLRVHLIRQ